MEHCYGDPRADLTEAQTQLVDELRNAFPDGYLLTFPMNADRECVHTLFDDRAVDWLFLSLIKTLAPRLHDLDLMPPVGWGPDIPLN